MLYVTSANLKIKEQYLNSLKDLFKYFKDANKQLFLVGGCVRDLLLDKTPKDYDLCTNATPEEVKKILENIRFVDWFTDSEGSEYPAGVTKYHFIDTGLKHGTVTIHDKEHQTEFEITTYRVDGKYSDGRHPDEVIFTPSLEEDLKRRDFTINSFAYNPIMKKLVMLDKSFLDDLKYGIIRTVGRSTDRFTEDALRMLRAFRFAAQLGFVIETETYEGIRECAPLMKRISKERIRDELTKILLSDNPRYLEFIVLAGLEPYLFNEITPMTDMLNCPHENPYHYTDVFHHTLDVVERVPKTFELRWAALFHDMGKPAVKALKPGTTNHYRYLGHEEKSVEIAAELMEKLKFSNLTTNIIEKFVKFHDTELAECSMAKFKKALNEIGVDNFLDLMKLREADSSAHNCIFSGTKYAIKNINICYDRYKKVLENPQTALTTKELNVNGYDIMELGISGKQVGLTLNHLLELVLENPELNVKEKLIELAKDFNK